MSEGIGSERLAPLRREHATLQQEMADPALHEDPARARRVGRRYAELDSIISVADQLASTEEDLAAARSWGRGTPTSPPRPSSSRHSCSRSASGSTSCLPPVTRTMVVM